MPIAAATHSVAAVVSPRTESPWRMIAPAPRKPIAPPSTAASERRARLSSQPSDGTALSKGSLQNGSLGLRDLVDPLPCEVEQRVQQLARERRALRRRLHLDQSSVAR